MTVHIQLMGRPSIRGPGVGILKGKKVWGLLAYLLLARRPVSRTTLAGLLFSEADDPMRALRWNLTEVRKKLGLEIDGTTEISVSLGEDSALDVAVLREGTWIEAINLPGFGRELLEGLSFPDHTPFDAWLQMERQHHWGLTADLMHEAAAAYLALGRPLDATGLATELLARDPYDESAHELLIRSYATADDHDAARRALDQCVELFQRELGMEPGPSVRAALTGHEGVTATKIRSTPRSKLDLGTAAVNAGAVATGIESLREAVSLAEDHEDLQADALWALGHALVHSVRGRDGEGAAILSKALTVAEKMGDAHRTSRALRELGYIDLLVARYDRAVTLLRRAEELEETDEQNLVDIYSYLGLCFTDMGQYDDASVALERAVGQARSHGLAKQLAYALCVLGRLLVLTGRLDEAEPVLRESLSLAEGHRPALVPWPRALLADVELGRGDLDAMEENLLESASLADQLDDPCWQAAAQRGLGLLSARRGDVGRATESFETANRMCVKYPDGYLWMRAYTLDALCELGLREHLPDTKRWIEDLRSLAARTGMRDMAARAHYYRAQLGHGESLAVASALAEDVGSPTLRAQLSSENDSR